MSQKRRRSRSPANALEITFHRSAPIKDRDSTFIGYYAPSVSEAPGRSLQAKQEVASASHRIVAWRTPSKQTSIQPGAPRTSVTGHDDDGEKWAGQKLERVLQEERVNGVLMVARWYGGVMLGPVRFTHIEKVAREAIAAWRTVVDDAEREAKRQKADHDTEARLRRELPERDRSVVVLRQLLAEKTAPAQENVSVKSTSPTSSPPSRSEIPMTPSKTIDYSKLPVDVLLRLEKARDTTIALLLRKIDEAEKEKSKPSEDR